VSRGLDALDDAIRAEPRAALVVLDVDGTLAPIVDRPEDAAALPGAADALRRLARLGATVALITGRPAPAAAAMLGLSDDDDIVVLGHYGLQRWTRGRLESPDPASGVHLARAALADLLAGSPEGVTVEDKEHSLVVHTRRTGDAEATLQQLEPALSALARRTGLELVSGRAVLELRPPGTDKGSTLRRLAADSGAQTIVYAGDDVADLDAFAALRVLAAQGCTTVAIASVDPSLSDTDPRVERAADVVLAGPEAVVGWLGRIATAS
jgi:trehalose 6-phosphate phosphatase